VPNGCHDCGGQLEPRVERDFNPLHPRWGAWCPRCGGWWPDEDDGTSADLARPAAYRLTDDPLTITPTGAVGVSGRAEPSLAVLGH